MIMQSMFLIKKKTSNS